MFNGNGIPSRPPAFQCNNFNRIANAMTFKKLVGEFQLF